MRRSIPNSDGHELDARLHRMPAAHAARTEARDYYEVLGAEPSASTSELRAAFREAVLRHHPDRAASSDVATRRTSILNRAWTALRDPLRRLHYDHDLEMGREETLEWPLDDGEATRRPKRRQPQRVIPGVPSPWHQPQWRSVAGFRVPADVFMAGPVAQERWIVEHHIAGEDWREHTERFWLRFAARHYAEHGRIADWLGALERMLEQGPPLAEIVQAGLREAYITAGEELRGRDGRRLARGASSDRIGAADAGPTASSASCSASTATSTCGAARSRSAPRTPSSC